MTAPLIDWTRRLKAADLAVVGIAEALEAQKEECRQRILAVASEVTQMNLASVAAAGLLSADDLASYRAGLVWIEKMRAAWRIVPAAWPAVPPQVQALARRF
jgi:hypothetical protein